MNNDKLLEILKTNSMTFTVKEIQEMMDEELNKNPEEMDTDLVDLCAEVLNKIYYGNTENAVVENNNAQEKKKETKTTSKRIKLRKIVLIAAIFMIITSIAIPVSAKYIHNEASDKIVQFFNSHFNFDLRSGNKNAIQHSDENIELIKVLKDAGFENIILPSCFLENNYSKEDIEISDEESYLNAEIDFEWQNNIDGYIGITKHKTELTMFIIGHGNIGDQHNLAKQITVNGMDILIFSNDKESYIEYVDNNIEYSISLNNCNFEFAVEIAESLK